MSPNPELILNKNGTVRQAGADRDLTAKLRKAAEKSLYVFAKGVMGMDAFTNHLHLPICGWMQTIPGRDKLYLAPRDTFKTSIARCLGMHITLQQPATNPYFRDRAGCNLRLLYAAENEARALSRIGWIRRQYEFNSLFRALWPELSWQQMADAPTWTNSRFSLPRTEDYPEATFETAGVDSGSTGGHYDVIIFDDLIGMRSRKQPQLMVAAVEWWKTAHSLRNDPKVSLRYVFGTRWAAEDLYTWIEENEGREFDSRIYSAIDRPSSLPSNGGIGIDGKLLFPERLTYEFLENAKRKYGELYYLNYENKAVGAGTTAFNMDFCGRFRLDGDTIQYDDAEPTRRILEVIEAGNIVPNAKPKEKAFYRMTAEERVTAWQKMQENWRRDRINRLEVS